MSKVRVLVRIDKVYGKEVVYPVCEITKGFARIAGTKTLTLDVIKEIDAMGFDVMEALESEDARMSRLYKAGLKIEGGLR